MQLKKLFLGYLLINTFLIAIEIDQSYNNLQITLEKHLANELNDAPIAQELALFITKNLLTWKAPTIPTSQISSIVAYAFGNRILPNGNHLPGPMNEALADLVVQLHAETNAPIYAQWEIVEAIGNRIPQEKLVSINPTLDAQANVVYLSTAGVASAIIKHIGNTQKLGKVAVIAFNDHLHRCIQVSRSVGMDACAPEDYTMPNTYDKYSGQPWTRNRLTYLVTDIKARLQNLLEKSV